MMKFEYINDAVIILAISKFGHKELCYCGDYSCDRNFIDDSWVSYAQGYIDGYNTYQPQALSEEFIEEVFSDYKAWKDNSEDFPWIENAMNRLFPKRS